MKLNKILALSAIFACGLTLAACNQTPTEQPTDQPTTEQPTTVEPTTEQPTTVEPTTEVPPSEAPAFNAAAAVAESVYVTYKDDVLRMEDFKLPTKQITYDDDDNMVVVDLAWELVFVDGIEGAVTAGEVDEDGNANFHVVYDAEHSTEVTNFKLICKVTDANGNEETIELNYNVPAFKYATYQEFAEAATAGSSDVLNVAGTVVAIYKTGVYLIDEQGYGFYAYSPVFEGTMDQNSLLAAYPIGSKVIASGTAALYNGQYEFNKGCSVKLVEAGSDYVIPYKDATEAFASAVSAKDKAALDHLQNTVVSINDITIADIDAANFYYYFTVGESNVKFYLRTSGSFNDFTNEKVNKIVEEWTEGYKANIKGLVTVYSGSYYITPIELDAVEITSRALSDAAKVEIGLGVAEREYGITYETAGEYELPPTDENGVSYTYEVLSGQTIKVEGGKLVVTPGAEKSQNVLKVTAKIGEIEESTEITVEVASALPSITSVADALLLEDGSQVYLEVTVDKVTSEWSDQYGNMRIDVTDGTGTLDCYRFSTKVEAGQKLLVKGTISSYNGKKQLAQGGTAEVLAYNGMTTISDALLAADDTQVSVLGTVKEINTEWSEQYGNITVTIVDSLGNELYIYRMNTKVNVGDVIVVDGKMATYNGSRQIAAKSTASSVEDWLKAHQAPVVTPVEINVTGTQVYTEGTITLGDYAVAFNENGTLVYASRLVGGYGGPADGFYHDGSYVRKDGEQCGMFNIDEVFQSWGECGGQGQVEYKGQMVSPWNAYEVVVPAGWTVVTGTWAEMASVMQAIDPAAVEDGNYFEGVEDGAFNGYAYSTKVDAPAVEITGDLLASFDFGDNGEAAHVDGNELAEGTSYEVGGYTLTLTGLSKVYGPAFDAQGNSAIKLGTSSKVGTFTFTVDASVNTVVINAACYKANASKITINGVEYELKGLSNEGTYDQIVIDTSTNKEVVLSTVSGACRAMVNSIELYGENAVSAEPVQLNASTLEVGDITEETTFGTFTIKATAEKKVTIDENSKSHDGVDYTQRIKLGGSGTADYRNITFSTEGACTITVIALSSSSGEDRELALFAADGTQIATGVAQGAPTDAKVSVITYTITEAGTFYIASLSGGINIYSIVVE